MTNTTIRTLLSTALSTATLAIGLAGAMAAAPRSAMAEEVQAASRGAHPAVAVQRLHAAAGYDYASKLYPHPASLVPSSAAAPVAVAAEVAPQATASRAGFSHPALTARRLQAQAGYDYASAMYAHPAGLTLAPTYEPATLVAQAR